MQHDVTSYMYMYMYMYMLHVLVYTAEHKSVWRVWGSCALRILTAEVVELFLCECSVDYEEEVVYILYVVVYFE